MSTTDYQPPDAVDAVDIPRDGWTVSVKEWLARHFALHCSNNPAVEYGKHRSNKRMDSKKIVIESYDWIQEKICEVRLT